jgi:hypothetical protein
MERANNKSRTNPRNQTASPQDELSHLLPFPSNPQQPVLKTLELVKKYVILYFSYFLPSFRSISNTFSLPNKSISKSFKVLTQWNLFDDIPQDTIGLFSFSESQTQTTSSQESTQVRVAFSLTGGMSQNNNSMYLIYLLLLDSSVYFMQLPSSKQRGAAKSTSSILGLPQTAQLVSLSSYKDQQVVVLYNDLRGEFKTSTLFISNKVT